MKTSNKLRKLIRACVDDERTLRHEGKFVDTRRAEMLGRWAIERGQFVAELERFGEAGLRHDGSWSELLREAWRTLRVTAAGRNDGDAIAVCRHSQARTEVRYDAALEWPWPNEIRLILEAQRRRLHDEVIEMNRLQF